MNDKKEININSHPLKVELVESADFHANSHPYKVEIDGGGDIATKEYVDQRIQGIAKIVDELPEEGEAGVTYFILKEKSEEGNIYDEYMYLTKEDGSKVWEHIGTTDSVDAVFATGEAVSGLKIYSAVGSNTDGLVLQKYVPDRLYVSNRGTTSGGVEYRSIIAKMRNGSTDVGGYFNILYTDMRNGLRVGGVGSYGVELEALPFTGATSSADGVQGMVPKPLTADVDKVLKGDGTWTINYKSIDGAGAPTIATAGDYVGQLYYDTTNDEMYYLASIDTSADPVEYNWNTLGGGFDPYSESRNYSDVYVPDGPNYNASYSSVVISPQDLSSASNIQNRSVNILGKASNYAECIQIGYQASTYGPEAIAIGDADAANNSVSIGKYTGDSGARYSVSIGERAANRGQYSTMVGYRAFGSNAYAATAIGAYASNGAYGYSVALGAYSKNGRASEVSVGSGGSDTPSTRFIANVTDPTLPQDAATKNYVDANGKIEKAGQTAWVPASLRYIEEAGSGAKGALFSAGLDMSDEPFYVGVGAFGDDVPADGYGPRPYLLTGSTSSSGAKGSVGKKRIPLFVEMEDRILAGGTTAPTTSTVGKVGTLYAYVENGTGHLAICTDVTGGTYTWQTLI